LEGKEGRKEGRKEGKRERDSLTSPASAFFLDLFG
jgi:hypothetical protein